MGHDSFSSKTKKVSSGVSGKGNSGLSESCAGMLETKASKK
ncbi:hypothetical protein RBSWK_05595 [Rhodopirellula baltica SWK14]|uniref:Uncharacterized protein n=1 Tax=Rhodopirellula baltica SWK14 TaxID=993516 RepID=L7CBN8_RHOBT|nr:hypothetical protein RBSWK_05595 [Rhodopirellula baltica SWK14]